MREGTVLAFDFGEKRIGVAMAELALGIAHPLTTIAAQSNDARFKAIGDLIAEWQPVQLVVGEPKYTDGGVHEIARLARRFAQRLNGRFNLPVALADETLSSATAAQRQNEAGLRGAELDAAAAAEILMTWLELQRKKTGETS